MANRSLFKAHAIEHAERSPADASTVIPVIRVMELAIKASETGTTLTYI